MSEQHQVFEEESMRLGNVTPLRAGVRSTSGGGPFDGGTELDELSDIKRRLDQIDGEQRTHLRWMVTIAIAMVVLLVGGFGFVMARIDRTEDRLVGIEERITSVQTAMVDLPTRLTGSLLELNQTLLQAITAASNQKQQTPVIVFPPTAPEPSKDGAP